MAKKSETIKLRISYSSLANGGFSYNLQPSRPFYLNDDCPHRGEPATFYSGKSFHARPTPAGYILGHSDVTMTKAIASRSSARDRLYEMVCKEAERIKDLASEEVTIVKPRSRN